MKTVLVLLAVLLLPGCASWQTFQSGIAVHGAEVADEQLETAQWSICEAPTVGALRRKYGANPEGLKAWKDFCDHSKPQHITP